MKACKRCACCRSMHGSRIHQPATHCACCCRAVRTLLGIDPSPGALFSDDEAPAAADPRARGANSRNARAETSIALAEMAGVAAPAAGGPSSAANQQDALEEARLAGGPGRASLASMAE